MQTISHLTELRKWRATAGDSVALVPTMGALHAGHMKLVEEAKKHAKHTIVSIFVNPTQFGPKEDLSKYPRPIEKDLALLREAGVDAVWLPETKEMYPEGFSTAIHIKPINEILEGEFRPGHFEGVATVVAKLFLQVTPTTAVFGEKDYQQLCLVKRLVNDLNFNVKIIGLQTVREESGLALSSRNQYLSSQDREAAAKIHTNLQLSAKMILEGEEVALALAEARNALRIAGFKLDYLELRAEDTLAEMPIYKAPARLLIAATLGTTRLIDNIRVE